MCYHIKANPSHLHVEGIQAQKLCKEIYIFTFTKQIKHGNLQFKKQTHISSQSFGISKTKLKPQSTKQRYYPKSLQIFKKNNIKIMLVAYKYPNRLCSH
jgi:hypothetical protein